ncbi:MAG TPA: hypothetical protein VK913_09975 [Erythrobacter sp.]|nr:hypothetical protein [Erythrobacter sp.]
MTDQALTSVDSKRDSLRARIEAAERRNADRSLADKALEVADAAVDYTKAHPLTVIGGAVATGLVIGLLTRPGRQVARRVVGGASGAVSGAASTASSGVKGIASRGRSRISTMLGQAAVSYLITLIDDAVEAARAGQDRAGELSDAAGSQVRDLAQKSRAKADRVVADIKRKTNL